MILLISYEELMVKRLSALPKVA